MKKGIAGLVIGSTLAYVAYRSLSEGRKEQLRQTVRDTVSDLKENAIDYALLAEDTADDLMANADEYKESIQDKVQSTSDKLNAKKDEALSHFANDNFDEQTASIREQLASAGHTDPEDTDDIVIDKTDDSINDQSESSESSESSK